MDSKIAKIPKKPTSAVKELITLHFGGTGIKIGESFWNTQCLENGVNNNGDYIGNNGLLSHDGDYISTYFNENKDGSFEPRTVMIDSDNKTIDDLSFSNLKDLFNPATSFRKLNNPSGIYANAVFIEESKGLTSNLEELLRQSIERCHNFGGFVLFDNLSGGSGSGFGGAAADIIKDKFAGKESIAFHLLPSPNFQEEATEYYNAVLGLSK